jgi:hypothetical protein
MPCPSRAVGYPTRPQGCRPWPTSLRMDPEGLDRAAALLLLPAIERHIDQQPPARLVVRASAAVWTLLLPDDSMQA